MRFPSFVVAVTTVALTFPIPATAQSFTPVAPEASHVARQTRPTSQPLLESGRRLASASAARQASSRPLRRMPCAVALALSTLGGAGIGSSIGIGTMLGAGSDGPGSHVRRAALVGAGVGLVIGAIACTL